MHVQRLRLVRVMREVGGLGIEQIREVLAAVDDPALPSHEVLGVAHRAVSPARSGETLDELDEVYEPLRRLGWEVSPTAPARQELAQALVSLRALGRDVDADTFLPHAHATDQLAAHEVARTAVDSLRAQAVEQVVVGTVVYAAALSALRPSPTSTTPPGATAAVGPQPATWNSRRVVAL